MSMSCHILAKIYFVPWLLNCWRMYQYDINQFSLNTIISNHLQKIWLKVPQFAHLDKSGRLRDTDVLIKTAYSLNLLLFSSITITFLCFSSSISSKNNYFCFQIVTLRKPTCLQIAHLRRDSALFCSRLEV